VEWVLCKDSGLMVPRDFKDDKEAMKENLKQLVEKTVSKNSHRDGRYFIIFHSRFDQFNPYMLKQKMRVTEVMPGFITNSIVFWVCNKRSICEWLWSVSPTKSIQFNTEGVAYLQAKGAMPS